MKRVKSYLRRSSKSDKARPATYDTRSPESEATKAWRQYQLVYALGLDR